MKKKYVVEADYEITNCNVCPIYLNEFEFLSADYCVLLDSNTDNICDLKEKLPNCPLQELKPKKLEWKKCGDYLISRIAGFKYSLLEDEDYDENTQKENKTILLTIELTTNKHYMVDDDNDMTDAGIYDIEQAKQFCQEHYNKLFYEMIGE